MGENATRADIALLWGRAGFGATAAVLDEWEGKPYAAAVDHLVDVPNPLLRAPAPDEAARLEAQEGLNISVATRWWMERMRITDYPLEERMTLFWHDHWATAYGSQVTVKNIMIQNQLLREHSLGNFRDMAHAVTIDPAMLKWLNGNTNVNRQPNENYARELFELFTLGVIPQVYTETDIQESARALTGWLVDGLQMASFRENNHDTGDKVVLDIPIGPYGDPLYDHPSEYKRVVDAALDQQREPGLAARFVAYKIVQNFAYAPATQDLFDDTDPTNELIHAVADTLTATGWDIREAMRTLLMHPRFREPDEATSTQHVRQPVEVGVHAAKVLGRPLNVDNQFLRYVRRAGQEVLIPPSVAGWPVGTSWTSQTALKARYDLMYRVRRMTGSVAVLPPSADVADGGDEWAALVGSAGFEPNTLDALQSYLASSTANEANKQEAIFILSTMAPEWQVI